MCLPVWNSYQHFQNILCTRWHCCIAALHIRECPSGIATVTEDTEVSFTCGLYTYQTVWNYYHDDQPPNFIGYCKHLCYFQSTSMFTLQAKTISQQTYESTVYIRNVTRQHDFLLRCTEGEIAATCRLRVVGELNSTVTEAIAISFYLSYRNVCLCITHLLWKI